MTNSFRTVQYWNSMYFQQSCFINDNLLVFTFCNSRHVKSIGKNEEGSQKIPCFYYYEILIILILLVRDKQRIIHGWQRDGIFLGVQLSISVVNKARREIQYLATTKCCFVYYMNTLLNKKLTLFTFPKENMLPLIYGAKESMSSADWQIISNIQNYRNFLQVEI